jgi:two-component system response regulator PrrA
MLGPVLVVGDDPAILASIESLLGFRDVACRTAPSGVDALAAAVADRPALVFLDLNMPGLDGIETFDRLRALGVDCPIVLMSATACDIGRRAETSGFACSLQKPFALADVFALLDRLLRIEKPSPN